MSTHLKSIVKLFQSFRYKHDLYTVFGDWCECAAITFSNAVDIRHREKREARYMEIVKRYDSETLKSFPLILGELTLAFEASPADLLGQVFHELELHNKARGQFFTPFTICKMMAQMTISHDEITNKIEARGFVRAHEPAVGSGAMIIALTEVIKEAGVNYQQCLHVTAVDVDRRAIQMAYIQFTLLHLPAVLIEGNTLSMQFRDEWTTCAHIIDGWSRKLRMEDQLTRLSKNMSSPIHPITPAPSKAVQLSLF